MVFGLGGLLPKELLANASIWYQLSRGLKMMNQAVEGLEVVRPGLEENIGHLGYLSKGNLRLNRKQ